MYFFILALFFVSITSPAFAADMRYPAGEEPLELPAHSALNAQLSRSAQNQEDKKLGAMSLYLTLMREDGRNVWAPYQLAVSSAEKGQTELAERYLQLSADRGLWYYYNLLEDDAFNSIQHSATYQSILAATKARYLQHARHYEGKASYAMPDGEAPPEGWPTVIFLHTYGKAAAISPEERLLFGEMGVAYIEINGTQMLSENSFRWSNYSDESTHTAIQRTLQQLAPQLKLNTQRIYLSARGGRTARRQPDREVPAVLRRRAPDRPQRRDQAGPAVAGGAKENRDGVLRSAELQRAGAGIALRQSVRGG